jgi:hypothetical protein
MFQPIPMAVEALFQYGGVELVGRGLLLPSSLRATVAALGECVGAGFIEQNISLAILNQSSLVGRGFLDYSILNNLKSIEGELLGQGFIDGFERLNIGANSTLLGQGLTDNDVGKTFGAIAEVLGQGFVTYNIGRTVNSSSILFGAGLTEQNISRTINSQSEIIGAGFVDFSIRLDSSIISSIIGVGLINSLLGISSGISSDYESSPTGVGLLNGIISSNYGIDSELLGRGLIEPSGVFNIGISSSVVSEGGLITQDFGLVIGLNVDLHGIGIMESSPGLSTFSEAVLVGQLIVDGAISSIVISATDLEKIYFTFNINRAIEFDIRVS